MRRFVLGIDVGGTNIKLGLVDPSGRVVSRTSFSTRTFVRSPKDLINALREGSRALLQENHLNMKQLLGIGIGVPGLVDYARGIVHMLTNIPGWKNVPLKKICEKKMGAPVFVDNDVKIMTLGEWKFGAGKGLKNLVCMTLGTGVGGGLVLDGRLYRGEGFAGELGHIPLNEHGPRCNCGGLACLERTVGNRYLLEKARKFFKNKDITIDIVDSASGRGDKKAGKFWHEMAEHIGISLVGVVNLLNPQRIIIGGGMSKVNYPIFKTIQDVINRRALKIPARAVSVVKAQLGDNAPFIGAQVLVKDATAKRS